METSTTYCSFGCGDAANHYFKSSNRHCCSKVASSCPAMRVKNSSSHKNKKVDLYDWATIQQEYDSGLSTRSIMTKYGFGLGVLNSAKKYNLFSTRTKKEARALQAPRKHTEESKKKISNYAKENNGGYVIGSGRGKKGWYKGIFCDSSWELAYLLYAEDYGMSVTRNSTKYEYVYEGKVKNYIPDFIVDGQIVEIKGYASAQWKAKVQSFPKPITVLGKDEMEPIISYVINKYGKDYVRIYTNKEEQSNW